MTAHLSWADLREALPLLFTVGWACLLLLADALGRGKSARLWPLAVFGLLLAGGTCLWSWATHAQPSTALWGGMLLVDRYALFFDLLFILVGLLTLLLAGPFLEEHHFAFGELPSLLLLVISGMMLLVHAADLVILVLGVEIMSLGSYVLVASWRGNRKSAEAGLKYYLLGGVASALLIYGVALLYGASGQTNLLKLGALAASQQGSRLYLLAMLLLLSAFAFKVALVPFHAWAPDAYEGAPTPVSGFLAAGVKAAAFGALLRVFTLVFGHPAWVFGAAGWSDILVWLAILTMTLGNLAALRQSNVKRLLAYSAIAHAGYLLLGVIVAGVLSGHQGAPILYYLLAYAVSTLGAFGVAAAVGNRQHERTTLEEWAGLAAQQPAAAAAMTLFLLSLAGVPPTAGFFAKLYLFRAALAHPGLLPLVIIAVLNSVVGICYYLRPVVAMYFHEEQPLPDGSGGSLAQRSGPATTALVLAAVLVLALGLWPAPSLEWATQSPVP